MWHCYSLRIAQNVGLRRLLSPQIKQFNHISMRTSVQILSGHTKIWLNNMPVIPQAGVEVGGSLGIAGQRLTKPVITGFSERPCLENQSGVNLIQTSDTNFYHSHGFRNMCKCSRSLMHTYTHEHVITYNHKMNNEQSPKMWACWHAENMGHYFTFESTS